LGELITRPWTLVTHIFIHDYPGVGGGFFAFFHILFNMLWLYWLGRLFREYLGDRNVYATFFMGAMAGALAYLIVFNLSPSFGTNAVLFGASAGVSAIVVGAATLLPNFRIMLLLFGAVELKWLALIYVVIQFLLILGGNAGGALAHLGGSALGFFFVTYRQKGVDLAEPFENIYYAIVNVFKPKRRQPRMQVHRTSRTRVQVNYRDKTREQRVSQPAEEDGPTEHEVNRILDKIHEQGYEKLTKEEKQTLFKYSSRNE
jgi:membrane associated rhomboid family serine protease